VTKRVAGERGSLVGGMYCRAMAYNPLTIDCIDRELSRSETRRQKTARV
jgi:hypothetical protein